MKKVLKCFAIAIICVCFINSKIYAEKYNCQYKNDKGVTAGLTTDYKFRYTIDTDEKRITSEKVVNNIPNGKIDFIADFALDSSMNVDFILKKVQNKCQSKVYICKHTMSSMTLYSVLFDDSKRTEIENSKLYLIKPSDNPNTDENLLFSNYDKCASYAKKYNIMDTGSVAGTPISTGTPACRGPYQISDKTNDCALFERDEEYTDQKESVDVKYTCEYYEESKEELKDLADEYKSCVSKNNACGTEATNHSLKLEKLKEYCKNVIAHQNYGDSCMTDCLNLKNEKDILITDAVVTIKCSLTEDIISMIYNVLKWIKYILPALIIILTMLDFIKAIAAQNDDDMKKAQGKFIKRLIVAALLFLLPLIINFVLQTFGFYNSGCDITDLL